MANGKEDPRVACVMITCNRKKSVLQSLEQLASLPERPRRLLVDNGSTDGTAAAVSARFPDVEIIKIGKNLGAAARTVGVANATAPYVALCDDDTWWEPGSLRRAADLFDAEPRLAVITARVLVGPDNREDPICQELACSPLPQQPGMPGPSLLGFLAGASVVRRDVFLEAGGFEPRFFIGGEEELLAADIAAIGYWICYVPELIVHHHPSPLRDGQTRCLSIARNALWFTWLRRPWPIALGRTMRYALNRNGHPRSWRSGRGLARPALGAVSPTRSAPRSRAGLAPAGKEQLMFLNNEIIADRLPAGTICLTYDDGPCQTEPGHEGTGPRTAELGAYLHSEDVPATFFAVGKFAENSGAILATLRSLGHLVANHTYDHPSLPAFVARGGDVMDQLARTNSAIGQHSDGPLTFFRPPYGDWRLRGKILSNVARVLNRSAIGTRFAGPIGWDIDAGDVGFWRDGRSAEECGIAYLEAIQAAERGIVLMHDSTADIDEIRYRNQALGLARWLVPRLRRLGFHFARLDQLPQVVSATKVSFQAILATHDGKCLSVSRESTHAAMVPRGPSNQNVILGVVSLDDDHWALRAPNGLYLSAHSEGHVGADALFLGEREIFSVKRGASGIAPAHESRSPADRRTR